MLGCHQNKRLKRLSCQLTITGSSPRTATRDGDTEPLYPLIRGTSSLWIPEMDVLHKSVSQHEANEGLCVQWPLNGMKTQLLRHVFCYESGSWMFSFQSKFVRVAVHEFPTLVNTASKVAAAIQSSGWQLLGSCAFIITSIPKHGFTAKTESGTKIKMILQLLL